MSFGRSGSKYHVEDILYTKCAIPAKDINGNNTVIPANKAVTVEYIDKKSKDTFLVVVDNNGSKSKPTISKKFRFYSR